MEKTHAVRKTILVTALMALVAIVGHEATQHAIAQPTVAKPELVIQSGHTSSVNTVVFSPDGKLLASGSGDNTIKLWEMETGRLLRTIEGHSNDVESVSFSPDGKRLASGGGYEDNTIKLWDVETGRLLRTIEGHSKRVSSVSFSPDGKRLASGSADETVKLWEVKTGRLVRTLEGHYSGVESVSFSPDGKRLASGSFSDINLWEVETGRLVRTFDEGSDYVHSVSFSPDGKLIASGSADNTIKLWEVQTGKLVRTIEGHSNDVESVSFSPDGKLLASGSEDDTIKLWEVEAGKLLCMLLYLDKEDWVVYTPEGLFDTTPDAKKYIGWTVGMKNYGFEQFSDEFYRPGLFSLVVSGQQVAGSKDIRQGFATPPDVAIVSPKAGETIKTDTVEVVVQATDTGGGVQDIRLYHNNKLVGREGRGIGGVRQSGKVVTQTFKVTLMEGENVLRATAYSADNIEAVPYEVKIRSAVAAKKPNLFIVAIGINTYKNPRYSLKYSRSDAEGIIKFFAGQQGRIYEKAYVTKLFDEQATRANILNALKIPTRPEDVVIIYFAGHGLAIDGKYYFLPYEIPGSDDANVKKYGVRQDEIISSLTAVNARKILMLLDTCQAGALVLAMRGVEEERAVKLLSKTAGVHVLAASQDSQAAAELQKYGHGLFTYALLQGLGGKADFNKDKTVRITELLGYVSSEVTKIAEEFGKQQYPTMDIHGDDFPVAVY